MSTGWSLFVAVLAAFNILGCVWLLWWTSKRRPGDPKPEDTSHYWDEDIAGAPEAVAGKTELDAVVAYLQGLGRHAPAAAAHAAAQRAEREEQAQ